MDIIIPTKDRKYKVLKVLESISAQRCMHHKIFVIDQSRRSILSKIKYFSRSNKMNINYFNIYPQKGLVFAKKYALSRARSDIVCFLEDDLVLNKNFLVEINKCFKDNPATIGVGGVCSNSIANNFWYVLFTQVFYLGLFKDSRPWLTFVSSKNFLSCRQSETLSGGISAWRREVFKKAFFVPEEGFHLLEDIHFCRKVASFFGQKMRINLKAKVKHFPAVEGRARSGEFEKRRIEEYWSFFLYHQKKSLDFICFFWLCIGLTIISILKTFTSLSFRPLLGHLQGIWNCFMKKRGV
jgi:GT2 family glycosyltransferase